MFDGCYKLKEIKGLNNFITTNVIDMTSMFKDCHEMVYLDLINFNTSNVINMNNMFNKCYKLKEIKGINNFITINVIDMSSFFQECYELEYLNLSNFETNKVTNMKSMFEGCYKLKRIKGLNNFITKKVIFMNNMFLECRELEYLDLSNFNINNVKNMDYMFYGCLKLKKIKGIQKFIDNKIANIDIMFQSCKVLDLNNLKKIEKKPIIKKYINDTNIITQNKNKLNDSTFHSEYRLILDLIFNPNENNENKEDNKIRIFGARFINKNKGKYKIIYKNKKFKLKEYFEDIDKNYNNDLIRFKLITNI